MKKLSNTKTINENYKLLDTLVKPFISNLLSNQIKNKQKILELCHLGKFLIFFNGKYKIKEITEKPDFIITSGIQNIGLEHQIIIDSKAKEREGFYQNLFDYAELKLIADNELPNFLASCILIPNHKFKISQKDELINTIVFVVKKYIFDGILVENQLIQEIFITPHSQKNLILNLGAWWMKDVSKNLIEASIRKKDKKLIYYQKENIDEQWLLLVIGNTGESSFEMDEKIEIDLQSSFDKIFILEDFKNNLYQLK